MISVKSFKCTWHRKKTKPKILLTHIFLQSYYKIYLKEQNYSLPYLKVHVCLIVGSSYAELERNKDENIHK